MDECRFNVQTTVADPAGGPLTPAGAAARMNATNAAGTGNLLPDNTRRIVILSNGTAEQNALATETAAAMRATNPSIQVAVATGPGLVGQPNNQLGIIRNPTQDFVNANFPGIVYIQGFSDNTGVATPMLLRPPSILFR